MIHNVAHTSKADPSRNTIYAPASGYAQKAGIIVVRLSGDRAVEALQMLMHSGAATSNRSSSGNNPDKPSPAASLKPRYATLANIFHPTTGQPIDQAIVVYFKAPHSFTGEDVAEISIHGSRAVLKLLLDALASMSQLGLRLAEPGEFTMRAVLNNKLDLMQAEGLADLIEAETQQQHPLALKQLGGELSAVYENWRRQLLEIMSLMEAHIDFPDEDLPIDLTVRAAERIAELKREIDSHLNDNRAGERLRDGLYVAIVGPTNAGKSSLLNKLAKRDVAIVSSVAGTTRDVIEVRMEIDGWPVILADTAGLRDRSEAEAVENEGMRRALERAEQADCKLVVLDATRRHPSGFGVAGGAAASGGVGNDWSSGHDESVLKLIDEKSIVVLNKIDLVKNFSLPLLNSPAALVAPHPSPVSLRSPTSPTRGEVMTCELGGLSLPRTITSPLVGEVGELSHAKAHSAKAKRSETGEGCGAADAEGKGHSAAKKCGANAKNIPPILASVQQSIGIDTIITALGRFAKQFFGMSEENGNTGTLLITRERHRQNLAKCSECLANFELSRGAEFAAEDIRMAATYLGRISGRIDVESMLGEIFSKFCIGK